MILQERIKELEKELEALRNANETLATNLTNEISELQNDLKLYKIENKYLKEQAEEVVNDYQDIGKQLSETCDELERVKFIEKKFNILDIALDECIARYLGITRDTNGIFGYDNYAKILKVRKDLVKLAKEKLENAKQD